MIFVPAVMTTLGYLPHLRRAVFDEHPDEFRMSDHPGVNADAWVLSWAFKIRPERCAAIETGFWHQAMHVDPSGLYANSSFNDIERLKEVLSYKAPRSAADIVLSRDFPTSKYRQDKEDVDWHDVVLALQLPLDRSVRSTFKGEEYVDGYWKFVEGACKHYGKHLLLKWHPMANEIDWDRIKSFANRYGSKLIRTNYSVIKHCKFVLVYNSTFAMDCFVRGVPVAQYAPGYWYKTGAVTYTDGVFPDGVADTIELGHKIADFCIWKYCFPYTISTEQWLDLLRLYASSEENWPLPEELSYAGNLEAVSKDWVFNF